MRGGDFLFKLCALLLPSPPLIPDTPPQKKKDRRKNLRLWSRFTLADLSLDQVSDESLFRQSVRFAVSIQRFRFFRGHRELHLLVMRIKILFTRSLLSFRHSQLHAPLHCCLSGLYHTGNTPSTYICTFIQTIQKSVPSAAMLVPIFCATFTLSFY